MGYKVGDEVLVKGKIVGIEGISTTTYNVEFLDILHETACVSDKCVTDKTYANGLNDAWNLAKKIGQMDCIYLDVIFGSDEESVWNHTYEEALAKIEAYEKEKSVCVGDVVEDEEGTKALVIDESTENTCFVFTENGCVEEWYKRDLKKTGKKIPISGLLRQIGE